MIAASRSFALDGDDLPPDTGDTRADLRALVDWLIGMLTTTPIGRALPMMVADRARVPELAEAHRAARRTRSARVTARCCSAASTVAISAPTSTSKSVIDSYVGPIFYRFLISDAPLDDAFADTLVDSVLRAFGT